MRSGTSSNSLYREIAERLIGDIARGRYAVGGLLPTELALADQFGVSRHTIRAALNILDDGGYISRKKAVGSLVESARPSRFTQTFETIDDLVRVAATEVRDLETIEDVALDRSAARRLKAPLGGNWIRFAGPRRDSRLKGRPIAWANIYIDPSFRAIVAIIEKEPQTLISALIERECGRAISHIHQSISATVLDDDMSRRLGVEPAAPGLVLLRHYRDLRDEIIEITETIYPADHVSISSVLRRGR